jgi:alpha-tubulin suppressor-like RCC1 family protein
MGLGFLSNNVDISVPVTLAELGGKNVVDIACGAKHTLALTGNGDIYSWGWNYMGQLGHGDAADQFFPRLIKSLSIVRALKGDSFAQIAAGAEISYALSGT